MIFLHLFKSIQFMIITIVCKNLFDTNLQRIIFIPCFASILRKHFVDYHNSTYFYKYNRFASFAFPEIYSMRKICTYFLNYNLKLEYSKCIFTYIL